MAQTAKGIRRQAESRALEGKTQLSPLAINGSGFVEAPAFMKSDPVASEIFLNVARHLRKIGVLEAVDGYSIVVYSLLQADFVHYYNETGHPLKSTSVLNALKNYSIMFGLDPLSRSRILIDKTHDEDAEAESLRRAAEMS